MQNRLDFLETVRRKRFKYCFANLEHWNVELTKNYLVYLSIC